MVASAMRSAITVSPRRMRSTIVRGRMLRSSASERSFSVRNSSSSRFLLESRTDPRAQQHRVERLRQVVLGAGLDAAHRAVELVEGRDHDDRNVPRARIGFEPAEHVEPVHPRHHQIEQHEVEALGGGQRERRSAVFGEADPVSFAYQPARQEIAVRRDIVDDEDMARDGVRIGNSDVVERSHRLQDGADDVDRRRRGFSNAIDLPEQAIGQVENLAEIGQQRVPTGVLRFLDQQFAIALDRVQRRAQVVPKPGGLDVCPPASRRPPAQSARKAALQPPASVRDRG